jgi:hypothetical protein
MWRTRHVTLCDACSGTELQLSDVDWTTDRLQSYISEITGTEAAVLPRRAPTRIQASTPANRNTFVIPLMQPALLILR